MEIWKKIKDWPYEVSSLGRVRRILEDGTGRGRILKSAHPSSPYPVIRLCKNGSWRTIEVHRLVCEAFCGERPSPKHEVAHYDGNKSNNVFSNLRWATRKENSSDRARHGTDPCGSKNGQSKLKEQDIPIIKDMARLGTSHRKIGLKFGVSKSLVSLIVVGKRWRHVN